MYSPTAPKISEWYSDTFFRIKTLWRAPERLQRVLNAPVLSFTVFWGSEMLGLGSPVYVEAQQPEILDFLSLVLNICAGLTWCSAPVTRNILRRDTKCSVSAIGVIRVEVSMLAQQHDLERLNATERHVTYAICNILMLTTISPKADEAIDRLRFVRDLINELREGGDGTN